MHCTLYQTNPSITRYLTKDLIVIFSNMLEIKKKQSEGRNDIIFLKNRQYSLGCQLFTKYYFSSITIK